MNACEMNILIATITNTLYSTLSKEDFYCLSIFVNELSKSMFSTSLLSKICARDRDDCD